MSQFPESAIGKPHWSDGKKGFIYSTKILCIGAEIKYGTVCFERNLLCLTKQLNAQNVERRFL